MEQLLTTLMENLPIISASCLAVIAGADKVFLILIATMGNIRNAWRSTFPKKYVIEDLDISKAPEYKAPGVIRQARKGQR